MALRLPLSDRARGRWADILRALGFPEIALSGKSQPCPWCGGRDRFVWDNKGGNGTFICRKCGAGDGATCVKRWLECSFGEAALAIEAQIPESTVAAPQVVRGGQSQKGALRALWQKGRRLTGRDPASLYLRSRGIDMGGEWADKSLRHVMQIPYYEDKRLVGYFSGMIAAFRAPDGNSAIIHRTFLNEDGTKAKVPKGKMFMPGAVPTGGAVRLGPEGETMGIAEGIETALAARMLHGNVSVWAATSAIHLMKWEPPEVARCVLIFADTDKSFTGQMAAYSLAHRLVTSDRRAEVRFVEGTDTGDADADWCDVVETEMKTKIAANKKAG